MHENPSGGIKKFQYHPELISLYNSGIPIAAVVGNVITPLLFFTVLYDIIPNMILSLWLATAFAIAIVRIYIAKNVYKKRSYDIFMRWTTISTAFNGATWGFASLLIYLYAPEIYLSFVITLIVGLIAATSTTLSPLYKTYVYYVFFATSPLIIVFLFKGGPLDTVTALLIMVFALFILVGGYKNYKKLYETIILKDRLKLLNNDLESEVRKRTKELEELNNSLATKVEEEMRKNRAKDQQLMQQSRMAQMGEMISMIAHQWRQPLGAIAASSIDLKMKMAFSSFDLDTKEQQHACSDYFEEQLTNIETYVESLTTTIDDFRNFYKPNKEKKSMAINEPIEKSLSIIEASAKANGIEIITDFQSQKSLALYDSEMMQVFLNIIKNAQDNFKEKKIENAKIIIYTEDTSNGVLVRISDNGGGISQEIIEKIFDPYFSTKDEKNGTGLGLYMSKTIIEEHHHGSLEVENRDQGACFTITLS